MVFWQKTINDLVKKSTYISFCLFENCLFSAKNRIRNSMLIQLYYLFLLSFSEPNTQIVGEPDIFVDIGSMLNLSCVVSYTERPPVHVTWIHNGIEVSFRGPRNGVSVSLMKKKINYCLDWKPILKFEIADFFLILWKTLKLGQLLCTSILEKLNLTSKMKSE